MTLSRQVLRKVDDALRAEFDQEKGEWMAKVPISGATKAVWQRYCQAIGVGMGEGVALLMLHELASITGEDVEALAERLETREAVLRARAEELRDREKEPRQRETGAVPPGGRSRGSGEGTGDEGAERRRHRTESPNNYVVQLDRNRWRLEAETGTR